MGFREAELLGFVLLFLCGNVCITSHTWTNETVSPSPAEQVTVSSQLLRSSQSNHTEPSEPVGFPVSYQLRSFQLRKQKTPVQSHTQTSTGRQDSESRDLTPEQQQEIKLPMQGPDLNPALQQEPKVLLKLEQRVHVQADSLAVRCGESEVTVEVKQDFLGTGQLVHPNDLTLGGCAASGATDHTMHFRTDLHGCSSKVKVTGDAVVYSFTLKYSPTPISSTFIFKTNSAEVGIECHYPRRQYVSSSGAVRPTWMQLATEVLAEQRLNFSLHLMTEDWQSQRPSSIYFLSDVIHMEAAVLQGHHAPLRVYVDNCVATVKPNPSSNPRYPFINNHGCFTDSKMTGAKSYFMQRSQENKLHFLLKAFKFRTDHTHSLYVTCHLKATLVSVPIDSQHKVCSFLTEANRWVASGGDNKVCSCCESSCVEQQRRSRSLETHTGFPVQWEETVVVGPVVLEDDVLHEELDQEEFPPELPSLLLMHEEVHTASHPSVALLCGSSAVLAVVMLVVTGVVTGCRRHKSTGYAVST